MPDPSPSSGQRAGSARFDLLDQSNSYLRSLTVSKESAPRLSNNINRRIKRSLEGLVLPPSETAAIDTLKHRVRAWWVREDGSEESLGVFIFGDASRYRKLYGSVQLMSPTQPGKVTEASMLDQLATLDQGSRGVTYFAPQDSIYNAIVQQLEARGVYDYFVEPSDARFGNWVVWKPNENALTIIYDLCELGGYYTLYFDRNGTAQVRQVPDYEAAEPDHSYPIGSPIGMDSFVESDSTLRAPNVYVVVNSGFTEAPVWGEWHIPAGAPHSYANRGFFVVEEVDMQGIEDNAAATRAAKAYGQQQYHTFESIDVDIAIDPTFDTFEMAQFIDDKYRVQAWDFALEEGDMMHVEAARTWTEAQQATPR